MHKEALELEMPCAHGVGPELGVPCAHRVGPELGVPCAYRAGVQSWGCHVLTGWVSRARGAMCSQDGSRAGGAMCSQGGCPELAAPCAGDCILPSLPPGRAVLNTRSWLM